MFIISWIMFQNVVSTSPLGILNYLRSDASILT